MLGFPTWGVNATMARHLLSAVVLLFLLNGFAGGRIGAMAGESSSAFSAALDHAHALEVHRQELLAAMRARELHPEDATVETAIARAHEEIGDALVALGREEQSLEAYGAAYAVWQRLSASDPANAEWQRSLSVIEERLGDHAYGKADYLAALAHYEASLTRMSPIRDREPSNAMLQRFTAMTMIRIGKARDKTNDETAASRMFDEALATIERLVAADPASAEWQRDRAVINEIRGGLFKKQGKAGEARAAYRAALSAYEDMGSRRPDDHNAKVLSVVPLAQLADLEPKMAQKHIALALSILKDAKAANRLDAQRETWIASLETDLAELGNPDAGSAIARQKAGQKPASATASPESASQAGASVTAADRTRAAASPEARAEKSARSERKPPRAAVPERYQRPDKSPFDLY